MLALLTRWNSHCNTCKQLSGGTYTLNQIIPKANLKITQGEDLGKYTYKGDSGMSPPPPPPKLSSPIPILITPFPSLPFPALPCPALPRSLVLPKQT